MHTHMHTHMRARTRTCSCPRTPTDLCNLVVQPLASNDPPGRGRCRQAGKPARGRGRVWVQAQQRAQPQEPVLLLHVVADGAQRLRGSACVQAASGKSDMPPCVAQLPACPPRSIKVVSRQQRMRSHLMSVSVDVCGSRARLLHLQLLVQPMRRRGRMLVHSPWLQRPQATHSTQHTLARKHTCMW